MVPPSGGYRTRRVHQLPDAACWPRARRRKRRDNDDDDNRLMIIVLLGLVDDGGDGDDGNAGTLFLPDALLSQIGRVRWLQVLSDA